MFDYIGATGLLLILAGWLYELWGVLRRKSAPVPLGFALLYGAGSLLLTYHSFVLGDTVFIALNAVATLIAAANIFFNLSGWHGARKEGKQKSRRTKKAGI